MPVVVRACAVMVGSVVLGCGSDVDTPGDPSSGSAGAGAAAGQGGAGSGATGAGEPGRTDLSLCGKWMSFACRTP